MKKYQLLLALSLFLSLDVLGQTDSRLLTLEEAIDMAIANNKDLKIERNRVRIAENNYFKGNAGLVPTVRLISNATFSEGSANIDIRTFMPEDPIVEIEESGVQSTTVTAGLRADYTLIGGNEGRSRYRLLENEKNISYYQQEIVLNELLSGISLLYLDLAILQNREELLQENVEISKSQLSRIEDRIQFGQATGTLALSAQSNINQELDALDNVRLLKNRLIKELNFLLGADPELEYRVSVLFKNPENRATENLLQEMLIKNPELKIGQEFVASSLNQLKLRQAKKYPQLNTFADYGYFLQNNDAQQLARLETLGFSAGLSLNFSIFEGKRINRSVQNARIEIENSETGFSRIEDQLSTELVKEQDQLALLKRQLSRQESNLRTFEDNFERTQVKFDQGLASSLDLREVQRSLFNAKLRISTAQLEIMKSEIRLKKLTGELIEEVTL